MTEKQEQIREQARILCGIIGPRATARKLDLKEGTLTKWASRYNWPVPAVYAPIRDYWRRHPRRQGVAIAREAYETVINENGEDTRLYLSSAALKASHSAAEKAGNELLGKIESQAVLNTARSADIVHGWTAQRQAMGVNVGVQVNIPLPDKSEREEMKAIDAKLDAIAAKLRE